MNDRTKAEALRYLTGHYENLSGHYHKAPVKHQDKLKLLKIFSKARLKLDLYAMRIKSVDFFTYLDTHF